jgi:hypothetical protein
MKNTFLLLLSFLFLSSVAFAQKKKKRKKTYSPIEYVNYVSGFYTYQKGGVRIIGDVYELTLKTNADNIIIDSVWFGATPVPCDVYSMETNYKTDTAKTKGTYLLKVNKNLYRNFYYQIDSSAAAAAFKAPFKYYSDALVMYLYKGKRYYMPIYGIEKKPMKQLRQ